MMWNVVMRTWWGFQEIAGPFESRLDANLWADQNRHKYPKRIFPKKVEQ